MQVYTNLILMLILVYFQTYCAFSQNPNTLTVHLPVGLAGDYALARPTWGSQSNNEITAHAIFGDPATACEPLINDVSGKIVFVDRSPGNICLPDAKALRAQQADAIAVIICNHLPAPEPLQLLLPGTVASQVTIPVFLATRETCNLLRVELTSGNVAVTIHYKCESPMYASNAVWGTNPGEGDFRNGLLDWTFDKGWVANSEGIIRNGAFTGAPKVVGSFTSCDGVAEFNSDYLDNRGMIDSMNGGPVHGAGDCPAPCRGFLLSPHIIFDKPLGGLTIEFTQSLRQFQSQFYIMVSKDGGVTFTDTVRLNTEYPVNSSHITERKRVGFIGFEGVESIRFKFECVGNYYYWAIDDVVVYDDAFVDLRVNRDWYSVSPYYKMPVAMVSEIPLMADISNNGNAVSENTVLNININGPSTAESFEFLYGAIPPFSVWKNRPFPYAYKSPSTLGRYTAEYFISSSGEEDGPDNRAGFEWHVTQKTFANLDSEEDRGENYLQFYQFSIFNPLPESRIYSTANVYYVPKGNNMVATKVRYGLENLMTEVSGQSIRIDLFEWTDVDNSATSSPEERIRVGTNIQKIHEDITNLRSIESDIWASDEDGNAIEGNRVFLKDNTHYLISVSVSPKSPETDFIMKLLGFGARNLDNYVRSIGAVRATNAALDSLEASGILGPRVAGSLFAFENIKNTSAEDIDKRNFRYIYNGVLYTKAYVEMDVEFTTAAAEELLPLLAVKTFPNPATRDVFIDLYLKNVYHEVYVSLYDMQGIQVISKKFYNISDERLKLDVSSLTSGVYQLKVITSEGYAIRKVVIQN